MNLSDYFNEKFDLEKDTAFHNFFYYYINQSGLDDIDIFDSHDAIEKWKVCLYPENLIKDGYDIHFGFLSYWLYKNDFYIEDFPDFFERFKSNTEFSKKELYKKTRELYGTKENKKEVAWQSRRQYIDSLVLKRRNYSSIHIDEELNRVLTLVSSRNADFQSMTLNEKLANIRNAFDNIAKSNRKFVDIPLAEITCGLISLEYMIDFSNKIQCFRHGEKEMIEERDSYTVEQKQFFVDLGLTFLSIYHRFMKNSAPLLQEASNEAK